MLTRDKIVCTHAFRSFYIKFHNLRARVSKIWQAGAENACTCVHAFRRYPFGALWWSILAEIVVNSSDLFHYCKHVFLHGRKCCQVVFNIFPWMESFENYRGYSWTAVESRNVCGFHVLGLVFSQITENRDHDDIASSAAILVASPVHSWVGGEMYYCLPTQLPSPSSISLKNKHFEIIHERAWSNLYFLWY